MATGRTRPGLWFFSGIILWSVGGMYGILISAHVVWVQCCLVRQTTKTQGKRGWREVRTEKKGNCTDADTGIENDIKSEPVCVREKKRQRNATK